MKNKKGDLMNTVLGIIIAVVGLSLLAYAGFRLYNTTVNQDSEIAKKTIDSFEAKMNALKVGDNSSFSTKGVEGWNLVAWSKDTSDRPQKCFFNSCICICPEANTTSCQISGFCRLFDYNTIEILPRAQISEFKVWGDYRTFKGNLMDFVVIRDSKGIKFIAEVQGELL